jgi:predicted amidophosphoribosyltransferase
LARALSRRLNQPAGLRLLQRRAHTRRQVALSRSEREVNLSSQIRMRRPSELGVVLVDDVFTTGATTRACFEAIRNAGAKPLAVVTVALAD